MDPRDKIFLFILGSLISLIILSIFMVMNLDPIQATGGVKV